MTAQGPTCVIRTQSRSVQRVVTIASETGRYTRDMVQCTVINDWSDFLLQTDRLHPTAGAERSYVFRGTSKKSYQLRPSLLRHLEGFRAYTGLAGLAGLVLQVEERALRQFIQQAHLHLPASFLPPPAHSESWGGVRPSTAKLVDAHAASQRADAPP